MKCLPNNKIQTEADFDALTESDLDNIRRIDSFARHKLRNNPGPKTAAFVARTYMQNTPYPELFVSQLVLEYSGYEADEAAIRKGIQQAKQYLEMEFDL